MKYLKILFILIAAFVLQNTSFSGASDEAVVASSDLTSEISL